VALVIFGVWLCWLHHVRQRLSVDHP
jgi:hypothetical protein